MLQSPYKITSIITDEIHSQMNAQITALSRILSRYEFDNKENHCLTRETIMKCIEEEREKSIEQRPKNRDGQMMEDIDTIQCSCA
jgi:hypothetical protein